MTKRGIIVLAIVSMALILPGAAFSQALESTDTEFRLFGIELGALAGYNLEDEESVMGRSFALSLAVLENMQIGISAVTFDGQLTTIASPQQYVGMRFDYFFTEQLALALMVGNAAGANIGGSIGAHYLIVRSQPADMFSSALKLKADYFFNDEQGIGGGTIAIGLAGSFGL